MSDLPEELENVRNAIALVVDQLDDLAFRELRHASARGETKRPQVEKRITRARNALLRASGLLYAEPSFGEDDS
jgi:hypothetical protein